MPNPPTKINTNEIAQNFLNKFDTFLFDCDGVIWSGNRLLPNVKEFLEKLRHLGKQFMFITNKSTIPRKQFVEVFKSFDIEISIDQVINSAYSSAMYVRDVLKLQPGKDKVWVFGECGIPEELNLMGFKTLGGVDPRLNEPFDAATSPFLVDGLDEDVRAVVAGFDSKINYHKLAVTLQYLLKDKEIPLVGADADRVFPERGRVLPGAGPMVESLAFQSGKVPTYCGKPTMNMLNVIVSSKHLDKSRCCMVGDIMEVDIAFGKNGNLGGTLLVLSGVETEKSLQEPKEGIPTPDFYAENLGAIYNLLK
ncbi:hypothetical protein KAFR_0F02330 [Kazachstania africana CBS 2517]|uniref:4-nitrophenylphosphatase n=1 Tax=Kazachstania africana (strain ATCC 22294 / BCRC 22015 / CBS 2517 / CECT 1963 / NBRC 1671 / NRRL Y-8276) TaxID=1071382 RepID=H2AWT0_KAZAF|nr:hypothetical protein KAFR_0F02330 [Kazachstania africana CBS 2517]CCF58830.1 hypothetical protein KAFR_0F02330 [Kazachstania africana CBS 2517]